MTLSEIINLILGGGLLALIVAVVTLKATVRKANAEAARAIADAEKSKAEADAVRITNTENATRILVENIVKPLKDELNATREELQATKREMAATKREMARLRKAIEAASDCPHADGCIVLARMRVGQKDGIRADGDKGELRSNGHDLGDNAAEDDGAYPTKQGGACHKPRQPCEAS